MYHRAKASNVIAWILEGETLDERQRRIQQFLENEGYLLPEPPRGVDRSEEGDAHIPGNFIAFQAVSALCVLSSNATNRRDGTLTPFTPGIERRTRNERDS